MKIDIIMFFSLINSGAFGSAFHTMFKNCSSLKIGDRYRIKTEVELKRNLTHCEQEWTQKNMSKPVGYWLDQNSEITSPVLSLTSQEIHLKKCVNLTLTLHCSQVETIMFLVYPDTETDGSLTGVLTVTVAVVVVAVVTCFLLAKCWYARIPQRTTTESTDAIEAVLSETITKRLNMP